MTGSTHALPDAVQYSRRRCGPARHRHLGLVQRFLVTAASHEPGHDIDNSVGGYLDDQPPTTYDNIYLPDRRSEPAASCLGGI